MRAIPIRGVMRPLNLTEREQQTGHLRVGVLNVDAKRPGCDEQGWGKRALSAKQERVRGGISAPAHWH